jgi:hypothetical protein
VTTKVVPGAVSFWEPQLNGKKRFSFFYLVAFGARETRAINVRRAFARTCFAG